MLDFDLRKKDQLLKTQQANNERIVAGLEQQRNLLIEEIEVYKDSERQHL
jgi:hypothetical protein